MLDRNAALAYHCPRWHELPALPLYMDQVILIVSGALSLFARGEEKLITASMINNYVKLKLVSPPEKKRYNINQVSRLIVFSLLKRVFTMHETMALIDAMVAEHGSEGAYDMFCEALEKNLAAAFAADTPLTCPAICGSAEELMQTALVSLLSKELVLNGMETYHFKHEASTVE